MKTRRNTKFAFVLPAILGILCGCAGIGSATGEGNRIPVVASVEEGTRATADTNLNSAILVSDGTRISVMIGKSVGFDELSSGDITIIDTVNFLEEN